MYNESHLKNTPEYRSGMFRIVSCPTLEPPLNYTGAAARVFTVAVRDLDLSVLLDVGLTYDAYLPEADGLHILCQCEYGQRRSAAYAAAIWEHFDGTGISIFADYRYYPNQVVYHKIIDALTRHGLNEQHHAKKL